MKARLTVAFLTIVGTNLAACAAGPGEAGRSARLQVAPVEAQAPSGQRQLRLFPPQDLDLLEGPDRAAYQKPDQIMDALKIADGSIVADIGAGAGWFTIRLARRVQQNGKVYT